MSQHDAFVRLRRQAQREREYSRYLEGQKKHMHRDPWQKREKAAIISWRKHGYSISTLARVFHRSSSSIQGILKVAENIGSLLRRDYRKIPNNLRLRIKAAREGMMENYMKRWLDWIAGEGDKPP